MHVTTTISDGIFARATASVVAALLLASPRAYAQVNEAFADLEGEIETVRSLAQTERKAVITHDLPLSATESQAFWPLYNQYRFEVARLQDRQVRIITDFAALYDGLTDADARKLLEEYVDVETELLDLRERYIRRFAQVLPGTKLMRYYQLENRLNAVANLTLAEIPLAE